MGDDDGAVLQFDQQVFGAASNGSNPLAFDALRKFVGKRNSEIRPALIDTADTLTNQTIGKAATNRLNFG